MWTPSPQPDAGQGSGDGSLSLSGGGIWVEEETAVMLPKELLSTEGQAKSMQVRKEGNAPVRRGTTQTGLDSWKRPGVFSICVGNPDASRRGNRRAGRKLAESMRQCVTSHRAFEGGVAPGLSHGVSASPSAAHPITVSGGRGSLSGSLHWEPGNRPRLDHVPTPNQSLPRRSAWPWASQGVARRWGRGPSRVVCVGGQRGAPGPRGLQARQESFKRIQN